MFLIIFTNFELIPRYFIYKSFETMFIIKNLHLNFEFSQKVNLIQLIFIFINVVWYIRKAKYSINRFI